MFLKTLHSKLSISLFILSSLACQKTPTQKKEILKEISIYQLQKNPILENDLKRILSEAQLLDDDFKIKTKNHTITLNKSKNKKAKTIRLMSTEEWIMTSQSKKSHYAIDLSSNTLSLGSIQRLFKKKVFNKKLSLLKITAQTSENTPKKIHLNIFTKSTDPLIQRVCKYLDSQMASLQLLNNHSKTEKHEAECNIQLQLKTNSSKNKALTYLRAPFLVKSDNFLPESLEKSSINSRIENFF